jgi:hypothetical protein
LSGSGTPGADAESGGGKSCRASCASCLPRRLENKTLRATYLTIAIVVASRSWDYLFADHLFPMLFGKSRGQPLTCWQNSTYFSCLLAVAALLIAFTATPRLMPWLSKLGAYRIAYMKLSVPAVGMAVGWAFAGVVTSCDA